LPRRYDSALDNITPFAKDHYFYSSPLSLYRNSLSLYNLLSLYNNSLSLEGED